MRTAYDTTISESHSRSVELDPLVRVETSGEERLGSIPVECIVLRHLQPGFLDILTKNIDRA